jgi:hypothetical protein
MEDAQSSARAALLKTWMSETQLIAFRRDRNAVEEYPLPPAGLTSEDSAATGLKFHDQGCARCGSKAIFQLNFSPDLTHQILKHQTMFFHGPERRRTALFLWGRWLDGRFSKGFLINVESPAPSVCLWAWSLEVGRIAMGGKQSFKQEYSAPPQGLTPPDCEADGLEFYDEHVV